MLSRILKYFIVIACAPALLSSCYTVSTMETEVLKPARYDFIPEIYRVGVVSRMDMEVRQTEGRIDRKQLEIFKRDSAIIKNGVLGMLDGLAESPRFEAYKIDPDRILKGRESILSRQLDWRRVDSLAARDDLDMLICMTATNFKDTVHRPSELFGTDPDKVLTVAYDGAESIINEDLKKSSSRHYIMFPKIYWRIYELEDRRVTERIQEDTIILDPGPVRGYYSGRETIEIFNDVVGYMGYEYSRVIAPYWQNVNRAWYPEGNYAFRQAGKFAREGEWLKASEIWRKLAYGEDRRVAARASFNMALASEMQDEFDIAIEWVNRSIDLGLDYYSEYYLEILKNRRSDKEKLDRQMKIDYQ